MITKNYINIQYLFYNKMDKKGILFGHPIDIIAGVTIFISGIVIIFGYINLGVLIATVGLLIEAIKLLVKGGLK